ncbi:Zinc finger CCCH-type [Penicillium verhagenii]|uniref:Zinc finger CCCH-type n=1 Tax=Penicillium verhagenii TaxID=1562060 RepID=UPI00254563C9|nr:Zinc finger CCCH-type [Penicillium verhagenii]KAJ5935521.1 Zinc finger CCCH-type [Penicillium verhagenii]
MADTRPLFFATRPDGVLTPMAPLDEFPVGVSIRGVPRTMNAAATQGMISCGVAPARQDPWVIEGPIAAGMAVSPKKDLGELKSVLVKILEDNALPVGYHQLLKDTMTRHLDNVPFSKVLIPLGPANSQNGDKHNRTGAKTKIYCSYWIRHGECDYLQQGCMYKHEMPSEDILVSELGLRDIPRWYREKFNLPSLLNTAYRPPTQLAIEYKEPLPVANERVNLAETSNTNHRGTNNGRFRGNRAAGQNAKARGNGRSHIGTHNTNANHNGNHNVGHNGNRASTTGVSNGFHNVTNNNEAMIVQDVLRIVKSEQGDTITPGTGTSGNNSSIKGNSQNSGFPSMYAQGSPFAIPPHAAHGFSSVAPGVNAASSYPTPTFGGESLNISSHLDPHLLDRDDGDLLGLETGMHSKLDELEDLFHPDGRPESGPVLSTMGYLLGELVKKSDPIHPHTVLFNFGAIGQDVIYPPKSQCPKTGALIDPEVVVDKIVDVKPPKFTSTKRPVTKRPIAKRPIDMYDNFDI